MPGFRQRFFRQNSLYQDSPKFNNAKVSGFTVLFLGLFRYYPKDERISLKDYCELDCEPMVLVLVIIRSIISVISA